jgi:NADPH:quinone reductase-like Zn-dependent oxidoreductase
MITIDLLLKVARRTILHPFVAWMIPLSLRAQVTPYSHWSFQLSVAYASFLTLFYFLSILNTRIAYGIPRQVDPSEEIIVITGGASGLGLVIAEFYAMRGSAVAVMDIQPKSTLQEAKGIAYYQCDVGNAEHVRITVEKIRHEVCQIQFPRL